MGGWGWAAGRPVTGQHTERLPRRPEAWAGTFVWIGTLPPPPHTLQSGQEGLSHPGLTESPQGRRGGAGEPRDRDGGGGDGEKSWRRRAENSSGPRPERRIPDLESQAARQTRKPFSPEHSGEGSQPALEKPCFCGKKEERSRHHSTVCTLSRVPHWATLWTAARRLLCPGAPGRNPGGGCVSSSGDLPPPQGSSPPSPAPAGGFLITEPPGTPPHLVNPRLKC